jgi:hypothetical protein
MKNWMLSCVYLLCWIGTHAAMCVEAYAQTDDSSTNVELPNDFDSLFELKAKLIKDYREANEWEDSKLAIATLTNLFKVEQKLLNMAEAELGDTNVDLANTYRATPQDDGELLAGRLMAMQDYERASEVYAEVLRIAVRRSDLGLNLYNSLLWDSYRAENLARATDEDLQSYHTALNQRDKASQAMAEENYSRAANLFSKSLPVLIEIGGYATDLAGDVERYAGALIATSEIDDVENQYLQAMDIIAHTLGRESARFAIASYNLGIFYRDQDRLDEALVAFNDARRIENRVGVDPESQMMTLDQIAGLHRRQENSAALNEIAAAYHRLERRTAVGLKSLGNRLPANTFLVASLDPASLLEDPKLVNWPYELINATCLDSLGIEAGNIQSTLAFLSLPFERQPAWGILLKPVAGADLEVKLPLDFEQVTYNQIDYRKSSLSNGNDVCLATLPEGVLIVGNESCVRQVLDVGESETSIELVSDLVELHRSGSLSAVFDAEKVNAIVAAALATIPGLPAELENLRNLPSHLSEIALVYSVTDEPLLKVLMSARDDSSVEKLEEIVTQAYNFGMERLTNLIQASANQSLAASNPAAVNAYFARMVAANQQQLSPVIENGQLVMRLQAWESIETPLYVSLLIPAIAAAREAAVQEAAEQQPGVQEAVQQEAIKQ